MCWSVDARGVRLAQWRGANRATRDDASAMRVEVLRCSRSRITSDLGLSGGQRARPRRVARVCCSRWVWAALDAVLRSQDRGATHISAGQRTSTRFNAGITAQRTGSDSSRWPQPKTSRTHRGAARRRRQEPPSTLKLSDLCAQRLRARRDPLGGRSGCARPFAWWSG